MVDVGKQSNGGVLAIAIAIAYDLCAGNDPVYLQLWFVVYAISTQTI